MRSRVSYANVASTLALVVALGGTGAYAAGLAKDSVTSKQIKNGAIKAVDIKKDNVSGDQVKESTLGKVPSAVVVDGLRRVVTPTVAVTSTAPVAVRGPLTISLYCDQAPIAAILQISTSTDNSALAYEAFSDDDFDVADNPRGLSYVSANTGYNLEPVYFTAQGANGTSITVVGSVNAGPTGCKADLHILG